MRWRCRRAAVHGGQLVASRPPADGVVRDAATGKLVTTLETGTSASWSRRGGKRHRITVKARDGKTDLYGLMYTPTNLDSAKKYPIINYIYPGPQTGSVGSRTFNAARGDHQALAELASWWCRSTAWARACARSRSTTRNTAAWAKTRARSGGGQKELAGR